jgi:hypothetical protein
MMVLCLMAGSLTIAAGCKKSAKSSGDHPSTVLSGKWAYVSNGRSIGGPLIWTTVSPGGWIFFGDDGSFQTNTADFSMYTSYSIIDSVKVQFSPSAPPSAPSTFIGLYYYHIDKTTGQLDLGGYGCIEGCVDRFTR